MEGRYRYANLFICSSHRSACVRQVQDRLQAQLQLGTEAIDTRASQPPGGSHHSGRGEDHARTLFYFLRIGGTIVRSVKV